VHGEQQHNALEAVSAQVKKPAKATLARPLPFTPREVVNERRSA
jgi:hypothetical protein